MSLSWLLIAAILPLSATGSTAAPSIEGLWKHRDKPAWIEFSFESGVGTAVISRHDDNPDAMGSEILIDIRPQDSSGLWQAKMYSAAADDFVGVILELSEDASSLVVTFEQEEILHLHRSPPS